MQEDCIFCTIVNENTSDKVVYESDTVLAFLDANPFAKGHTLVISKSHQKKITDLEINTVTDMYSVTHNLTNAIESAMDAPASTIFFNNGEAAGQKIPHAHIHIIPQYNESDVRSIATIFEQRIDFSENEFEDTASKIRSEFEQK